MSVLAVIAARNEAGNIAVTLQSLIAEGVEVVLVDNGSIDGTREVAESFLGAGLLGIRDVPWQGVFDLAALLAVKQCVFAESTHDWFMHVDADEWPRACQDMTLSEMLTEVIDCRYSVVNFREYVFLPPYGVDLWGLDYRRSALDYYFFAPSQRRLMRAWRRGTQGSNLVGAGHTISRVPPEAVYPEDQTLRHYVGLSWSHAIGKRANRTYLPENLAVGWHANRLDMRAARPPVVSALIKRASPWDTRALDGSQPSRYHFWERGFYGGTDGS